MQFYNLRLKGFQKIKKFSSQHLSRKSSHKGRDYILKKEDLSELVRLPVTHFLSKCEKDDVLSEVHFCWRFQREKGIYTLPCQNVQNETIYPLIDSCPDSFQLLDYGAYGRRRQKRVTRRCKCGWKRDLKGKC